MSLMTAPKFRVRNAVFALKAPKENSSYYELDYEDGWCNLSTTENWGLKVCIAMPQDACAQYANEGGYFKTFIHGSCNNPRIFQTTIEYRAGDDVVAELMARVLELMALMPV